MKALYLLLWAVFIVIAGTLLAFVIQTSLGVPESRARTLREVPRVALATTPAPGVQRDWVSRPDVPVPTSPVRSEAIGTAVVAGRASFYEGSRGFHGVPHVATPHGRWTGRIEGWVRVCVVSSHICETLPTVDRCGCYKGTDKERVVDLSYGALDVLGLRGEMWRGLFRVTVEYL